jgi:hypothetical protein
MEEGRNVGGKECRRDGMEEGKTVGKNKLITYR